MSNASEIVLSSLLRAISLANANKSSKTSSGDAFDSILESILGNTNYFSNSCDSCRNSSFDNLSSLNTLETLNTLVGAVNDNKINSTVTTDTNKPSQEVSGSNNVTNTVNSTNSSSKMDKAIELLKAQVGKKYVWGATGPNTFDCSGLVQYIYKNALGKNLPRVSADQSKYGQAVDKKDLQVGDLVFFDTMNKGRVSHVGMYIGNNEFIHAANSKSGVKKSSLSGYYEKKYVCARRP